MQYKVLHTQKLGAEGWQCLFSSHRCTVPGRYELEKTSPGKILGKTICTFNLLVNGNTFNPSQLRLGLNVWDGPRALTINICFHVATCHWPFIVFYYFMAYQFIFWLPFHYGKEHDSQHNVKSRKKKVSLLYSNQFSLIYKISGWSVNKMFPSHNIEEYAFKYHRVILQRHKQGVMILILTVPDPKVIRTWSTSGYTDMISEEQAHWNWKVAPDIQWVNRNQGQEVQVSEIMLQKYFEFCLLW